MILKMAEMEIDDCETKVDKSVSFGFVRKKQNKIDTLIKSKGFKPHDKDDLEDEKDWITSAEGKVLQSSNPKTKKGPLVIPMIKENKWRLPGSLNGDDDEAAREIFEDLKNGIEEENNAKNFAIPLLMRNKLPVANGDHNITEDELTRQDVSLRPETSTDEDYENIPISAFGAAMLRGMGWAEGKPIGLTNKSLCEPIEFIPRHKGLGLGAQKMTTEGKQRKRKPGDPVNKPKNEPIVGKDGRVRHIRRLGETGESHQEGLRVGAFVAVTRGIHANMYAKVVAMDEDNARATIQIKNSQENVNISQHYINEIERDEYNDEGSKEEVIKSETSNSSQSKKLKLDKVEQRNGNKKEEKETKNHVPNWLVPDIRVRIVHKKFCNGRYYNAKVSIVDVATPEQCICQTEDGKLIEDVQQKYLETIIPKSSDSYIMVVAGKYRGELGRIVDREKKKYVAHVQLLRNKHTTRIQFDDLSEFVGRLPNSYIT